MKDAVPNVIINQVAGEMHFVLKCLNVMLFEVSGKNSSNSDFWKTMYFNFCELMFS